MEEARTLRSDDRHFYDGSFPKQWNVIWEQDVEEHHNTYVGVKKETRSYRIVFCCPTYDANHGTGQDLGGALMLERAHPVQDGEEPSFEMVKSEAVDLRQVHPDEWASVIIEKATLLINWLENWLHPSWRMSRALDQAARTLTTRVVLDPNDGSKDAYERFTGRK